MSKALTARERFDDALEDLAIAEREAVVELAEFLAGTEATVFVAKIEEVVNGRSLPGQAINNMCANLLTCVDALRQSTVAPPKPPILLPSD